CPLPELVSSRILKLVPCRTTSRREHEPAGPASAGHLPLLLRNPVVHARDAIADSASDLDEAGTHVETAPVREGPGGQTEGLADLLCGEQLVHPDDVRCL